MMASWDPIQIQQMLSFLSLLKEGELKWQLF